MSDDLLDPPPPRELPGDVLDTLRARLWEGMADRPRPTRPLAVAAAVVLLAGGAFVVTSSVRDDGQQVAEPPESPPSWAGEPGELDLGRARTALDRCWAALRANGKATGMPDRSSWEPVLTTGMAPLTVVGAKADGKPFFCETTATSVTVSDPGQPPAAVPGSGVGTLLFSSNGVVAGVAGPDWPWFIVHAKSPGGSFSQSVSARDGMFAVANRTKPAAAELSALRPDAPRGGTAPLPAPGPPLLSVVDRPVSPPPDRTSDRGRFLGECLAESEYAVIDPGRYEPGAMVSVGPARLVVSRSGDQLVHCATGVPRAGEVLVTGGQPVRAYSFRELHVEPAPTEESGFGPLAVGGVLPAEGASMTLRLAGTTLTPDVRAGTWAVAIPNARQLMNPPAGDEPRAVIPAAVTVRDAQGGVIFEGSVDIPLML